MTQRPTADPASPQPPKTRPRPDRVIGHTGPGDGPVVIAVGGIHGNEHSGVEALERIHARLRAESLELRGELLSLRGNVGALARNARFVHRDLNRMWRPRRMAALLEGSNLDTSGCAEAEEQVELFRAIAPYLRGSRPIHFIDLHTASSRSVPFGLVGDTLRSAKVASAIPIPVLFGLEEQLQGSMLEAIGSLGHVTLGVEGGQHGDPAAVDCIEAAAWIALATAGMFGPEQPEVVARSRRYLEPIGRNYPQHVEVLHRHGITPEEEFTMDPGYANFTRVVRGQPLARDARGMISAPRDGYVLLPLYQGLGDDGFFVGRKIGPVRHALIRWLRRLGLDRLVSCFPGVRRLPPESLPETPAVEVVAVDAGVDPIFRLDLLPALGFRRAKRVGDEWWLSRRPEECRSEA